MTNAKRRAPRVPGGRTTVLVRLAPEEEAKLETCKRPGEPRAGVLLRGLKRLTTPKKETTWGLTEEATQALSWINKRWDDQSTAATINEALCYYARRLGWKGGRS